MANYLFQMLFPTTLAVHSLGTYKLSSIYEEGERAMGIVVECFITRRSSAESPRQRFTGKEPMRRLRPQGQLANLSAGKHDLPGFRASHSPAFASEPTACSLHSPTSPKARTLSRTPATQDRDHIPSLPRPGTTHGCGEEQRSVSLP